MDHQGTLGLVEVAHLSDTGRVRHHNEDRWLATTRLLAVADGMGGAKAGEVAAQAAVDALSPLEGGDAQEVRSAVEGANRTIRRMAEDDPERSGMGTTVTAAMLAGGRLEVVHVGDSRAYLWRDGVLTQITEDHSVVAELVRRGSITEEEAELHPHRNVITRALGAEAEVTADVVSADVRQGDVVLLCSDGLSSYVAREAIAAALAGAATLTAAAKELVALANAAGGVDNVTVVLARIGTGADDSAGDTVEVPHDTIAVAPPAPGAGPARRRPRARPIVAAALVVVLAAGAVAAWVGSRNYGLREGPDGTVVVARGLPVSVLGLDLASDWQDTGVHADVVRDGRPGAISSSLRGQGEAVEEAVVLVWRFGMSTPPVVRAQPETAPAPAPGEATPGTTTAP